MAIFNSYVKLPEGKNKNEHIVLVHWDQHPKNLALSYAKPPTNHCHERVQSLASCAAELPPTSTWRSL